MIGLFIVVWIITGMAWHFAIGFRMDIKYPNQPSVLTEPMFWFMLLPAIVSGPFGFVTYLLTR